MLRSCRNCRRARRGCDKTKPSCRTCRKNGFQCEGYIQDKTRVFVNLGVGDTRRCDRTALIKAVRHAHRASDSHNHNFAMGDVLAALGADLWSTSIHCLDLTETDFEQHLKTLWNHFDIKHSLSTDAWVPSFNSLVGQTRYLDLALIALSALRFSQATHDNRMRVMSLTAYGKSLQMLRRCVEDGKMMKLADLATVATASMVFALYEAMHCSPDTIFDSGVLTNSAHIRGARIFMQKCGPRGFQQTGLHLVFRKIREMVLLDSYCNHQRSFLADPDWIAGPWMIRQKTFRDSLFDVAARMTELAADVLRPNVTGEKSGSTDLENLQQMLATIGDQLDDWERTWIESLDNQSRTLLSQLKVGFKSLDCVIADGFPADTLFLHLELTTLRLIWTLCCMKMAGDSSERLHTFESPQMPICFAARHAADALADEIETILSTSMFSLHGKADQGITEGQCRSLLPAWSLLEYKRIVVQHFYAEDSGYM